MMEMVVYTWADNHNDWVTEANKIKNGQTTRPSSPVRAQFDRCTKPLRCQNQNTQTPLSFLTTHIAQHCNNSLSCCLRSAHLDLHLCLDVACHILSAKAPYTEWSTTAPDSHRQEVKLLLSPSVKVSAACQWSQTSITSKIQPRQQNQIQRL